MYCIINPFHCHQEILNVSRMWLWVLLLLWCISCCGWEGSWLKSATAQCSKDTYNYLGPAKQSMILLFLFSLAIIKPISPCLLLFLPTVTVTKEGKRNYFKVGAEEAESILVRKRHKTGISRHTGKHQSNFSLDRMWLDATLQCNSLLLMAN